MRCVLKTQSLMTVSHVVVDSLCIKRIASLRLCFARWKPHDPAQEQSHLFNSLPINTNATTQIHNSITQNYHHYDDGSLSYERKDSGHKKKPSTIDVKKYMSASYTLIYAVYGVVAHGRSTIQHIMIVRVVCGTRVLARLWKIDTHIRLPTKKALGWCALQNEHMHRQL